MHLNAGDVGDDRLVFLHSTHTIVKKCQQFDVFPAVHVQQLIDGVEYVGCDGMCLACGWRPSALQKEKPVGADLMVDGENR